MALGIARNRLGGDHALTLRMEELEPHTVGAHAEEASWQNRRPAGARQLPGDDDKLPAIQKRAPKGTSAVDLLVQSKQITTRFVRTPRQPPQAGTSGEKDVASSKARRQRSLQQRRREVYGRVAAPPAQPERFSTWFSTHPKVECEQGYYAGSPLTQQWIHGVKPLLDGDDAQGAPNSARSAEGAEACRAVQDPGRSDSELRRQVPRMQEDDELDFDDTGFESLTSLSRTSRKSVKQEGIEEQAAITIQARARGSLQRLSERRKPLKEETTDEAE